MIIKTELLPMEKDLLRLLHRYKYIKNTHTFALANSSNFTAKPSNGKRVRKVKQRTIEHCDKSQV